MSSSNKGYVPSHRSVPIPRSESGGYARIVPLIKGITVETLKETRRIRQSLLRHLGSAPLHIALSKFPHSVDSLDLTSLGSLVLDYVKDDKADNYLMLPERVVVCPINRELAKSLNNRFSKMGLESEQSCFHNDTAKPILAPYIGIGKLKREQKIVPSDKHVNLVLTNGRLRMGYDTLIVIATMDEVRVIT